MRKIVLSLSFVSVFLLAETRLSFDYWNKNRLKDGILMIRHAYAPGYGDPENFELGDCTTQRNLNQQGRKEAVNLGEWLKKRGYQKNEVEIYSSKWCRTLETARLMAEVIGAEVECLPALNSFFETPQDKEPNLKALRKFLIDRRKEHLEEKEPKLIILITHQVTIQGLTSWTVPSTTGVLLRYDPNSKNPEEITFRRVAIIPFDQKPTKLKNKNLLLKQKDKK